MMWITTQQFVYEIGDHGVLKAQEWLKNGSFTNILPESFFV